MQYDTEKWIFMVLCIPVIGQRDMMSVHHHYRVQANACNRSISTPYLFPWELGELHLSCKRYGFCSPVYTPMMVLERRMEIYAFMVV